MSNDFEVGQKVACVDNHCVEYVLEKGKRYTIKGVHEVFVQVEGISDWFYYDRFTRVYAQEQIKYDIKDQYGDVLRLFRLNDGKVLIKTIGLSDDDGLSVHLTNAQVRDLRKILKEI